MRSDDWFAASLLSKNRMVTSITYQNVRTILFFCVPYEIRCDWLIHHTEVHENNSKIMSHYGMGSIRSPPSENGSNGETSEVRRNIQDDWQRRDDIQLLTTAIKRLVDFLNQFGILIRIPLIFLFFSSRIFLSISIVNLEWKINSTWTSCWLSWSKSKYTLFSFSHWYVLFCCCIGQQRRNTQLINHLTCSQISSSVYCHINQDNNKNFLSSFSLH